VADRDTDSESDENKDQGTHGHAAPYTLITA
jgi:hypothetical protein